MSNKLIDVFAELSTESLENMVDECSRIDSSSIDDLESFQNYSSRGRWAVFAYQELAARSEHHPAYREKMRQRAYEVCIAPMTDPNFVTRF